MGEKLENALRKFMFTVQNKLIADERGDSNMVAVVVLIIIVIAVAVIFRDGLMKAVQGVMDQFSTFITETTPS